MRLQSSYDGPLNFNIGANYLDFKSQDDYFVYNNLFTLIAQYNFNGENEGGDITRNCGEGTPTGRECVWVDPNPIRSEEHTSELQSLMRNSYAVFCLKKKKKIYTN